MTGIPDHLEPVGTHKRQQSGNVPLPFNGRCSAEWMLTVDKEVSSVALPFPHQKGRQRDLASGKDVQLDLRLFFFFLNMRLASFFVFISKGVKLLFLTVERCFRNLMQ